MSKAPAKPATQAAPATKQAAPKTETKPAVPVPETKAKDQKASKTAKQGEQKKKESKRKRLRAGRKAIYKRASKYAVEYHKAERNEIRLKRMARRTGSFYVPAEPKLAIVIRIRGINGVSPKVRKILKLLRLRQLHNAVFVKVNKPTLQMLHLIEPYIAYGYPNLKTVRELIYKRGYGKVNGQRIPFTSNHVISDNLKQFNILCVEDLIHEVFTVGPNFKKANNFLWPFKLTSPRGGFIKKLNHVNEGGDAGDHEELINGLVQRMN